MRYARELRDDRGQVETGVDPDDERRAGAARTTGRCFDLASGPAMIRDEDGQLAGYVFVDMAGRDIGSYVEEAQKKVAEQVKIPTGYTLVWSGQYEYMQRAKERLIYVVPLTLLIIFILLYINFKSVAKCVHRAPGRPFLHDRRGLVALSFGIQHERRRVGRHHRVGRGGR